MTTRRAATVPPTAGGEMGAAEGRPSRPGHSRQRYAIVPDWATQAQYIWDPDADAWYGPFATRWDAEMTLVRWRAERSDEPPGHARAPSRAVRRPAARARVAITYPGTDYAALDTPHG